MTSGESGATPLPPCPRMSGRACCGEPESFDGVLSIGIAPPLLKLALMLPFSEALSREPKEPVSDCRRPFL